MQDYHFSGLQTRMHECFAEKAFDIWAKNKRLPYKLEVTKVTTKGAIVLYREIIESDYWTTSKESPGEATGRLKRRAISKHRYLALEASD
jgi:hypothetical protein